MASILNQTPYLRTSRDFPKDAHELTVEVDKAYIDIANAVNNRSIGIYAANRPVINGDAWYLSSLKQQGLRQVFTFTATGNLAHGLKFQSIAKFVQAYGSFTDGTNWYGAIYGSNTAIAGQVSFYITPTNIVILGGAGAPAITSGTIVLEWLSNV